MPINVFIWCPVVNQGGGHRLLTQLANALGAHAGIGRLALATPQQEHAFLRQGGLDTKSVELVALEPPPPQEWLHRWLWQDQRILGLKGTRSLKHWLRGRTGRTHLARERSHLGQLLRGFDVFYAFWPLGTVLPEVSLPVVCTVHDAINFEFPELFGPAETNRLQPEMQAWLERSQRVTVSSHYTGQRLRRIFGNFAGQIRVVDFFAMPKDAQPGQNHDACRAFHLTPGYVLNAANITAHKNHYQLLLAWRRVREQFKQPLVLCGGGTDQLNWSGSEWPAHVQAARLAALVRRLELKPGTDFKALGFIEDKWIRSLIQNAALLVMPSLAEGGSYPVEEALHLGTPVACADIPVMREHLRERQEAVAWFDPESPEAISGAIQEVLAHLPEYREKARLAGAKPRPTWDEIAEAFFQVFRECA